MYIIMPKYVQRKQGGLMPQEEYEENCDIICDKLAINNDYDGFWDLVRNYIDASL